MSATEHKIVIVGPGAIGTLFAFYLKSAGIPVALAGRNPRRGRQVSTEKIKVEIGSNKIKETSIELVDSRPNLRISNPDYVIFAVKAYDTEIAAKQWKSLVGLNTYVVSLQNGLGNLEILKRFFDVGKLIIAVTSEASFLSAYGKIHHTASGITKVAPVVRNSLPAARRFAEILQGVGLEAITKNHLQNILWGKLVVNSAMNPLSAITGLSNGDLLSSDSLRKIISEIATETYRVGRRVAHVNPDLEGAADASSYVLKAAEATTRNKSSMLQDLLRGKRTEVDFINGAVCSVAESMAGFKAPLNEAMLHLVRALEGRVG